MAIIDTDKVVTVSQLVDELHVSIPTARGLVVGLEPEATINRTSFFLREDVKVELRARNEHVLKFLGILSQEESYDTNVIASAQADEDGE